MPEMNRLPDNHPYSDTLIRRWELLHLLSRSQRKLTIADIRNRYGFSEIPERMLQRDLKYIQDLGKFGLKVESEQKPYKWCIQKTPNIPGFTDIESLSLVVLENEIMNLLPHYISVEFADSCKLARERLLKLGKNSPLTAWINKVRTVSAGIPLLAPVVDNKIKATVYEALLHNQQIELEYKTLEGTLLTYKGVHSVNPLGLVQQGPALYLIVNIDAEDYIQVLALHRIQYAKSFFSKCRIPANFNLDTFLATGGMGRVNTLQDMEYQSMGCEMIQMTAKFTGYSGEYLVDTKMSEDQAVTRMEDGVMKITATVPYSPALIQWLSGFGANVKILEPSGLHASLLSFHQDAIASMVNS